MKHIACDRTDGAALKSALGGAGFQVVYDCNGREADEAAITNSRSAVQVYGGMGFTWEVPVHLYLKRARVLASSLGTRSELAEMLASLG